MQKKNGEKSADVQKKDGKKDADGQKKDGGKAADGQKKDGGKAADGQKKGGKKSEKVKPRVKSDLVLARADVNSTDFLNVMEYTRNFTAQLTRDIYTTGFRKESAE